MSAYAYACQLLNTPNSRRLLPSPCLVVDPDAMKRNFVVMHDHCKQRGIELLSHGKAHRCPRIAAMQIEAGSKGICVTSVAEAEHMVSHEINKILITSQVVDPQDIHRVLLLRQQGIDVAVVVDNKDTVALLAEKAMHRATLSVYVDIDMGRKRSGTRSREQTLAVARLIEESEWLTFAGLQCYAGQLSHEKNFETRRKMWNGFRWRVWRTINFLKEKGIDVAYITGGATGTMFLDQSFDDIPFIAQYGSYALWDYEYMQVDLDGNHSSVFEYAAWVKANVISANYRYEGLVTVNVGDIDIRSNLKYTKGPVPIVVGHPELLFEVSSDAHGKILNLHGDIPFVCGDTVEIVLPHSDPSVYAHQWACVCEGDTLVDLWEISSRGL